jgi:DGQHR domain-containing protein
MTTAKKTTKNSIPKVSVKKSTSPKKGSITQKSRTYDAQLFLQRRTGGPALAIFHAPVKEILQWAEIGELGPKSGGPQREKKEVRVQAISKFLNADEKNTIPTALILAFTPGKASFKRSGGAAQIGTLSIITEDGYAATIVDGQHRLYGINEFNPNTNVAIVAILDADPVERAFQFLVINNKSSRVAATHTKALLAKMKSTSLVTRLKGAKLAFDVEGIKDIDLVNSDRESPFFQSIDWTTTPAKNRMIQGSAIELSLDYLGGLGIPEFDDRDVRRSVFLTIWKVIKIEWKDLWKKDSRLVSKVGIICLTRFIVDRITYWADSDELEIEVTDLEQIEDQTKKIIGYMDVRFWTTPWAEKASGGFDTNQGRDRVLAALTTLFRNGRRDSVWYADIDILERSSAAA